MITTLVTAPAVKPVSIDYIKRHTIIEGSDEDVYLGVLLDSATAKAEDVTNRKLITQTWKGFLGNWPSGDYITVPYGSLQSVTHVKYKDSDGTQYTMDSGDYIVDTDSDPGRIVLGYGETWPNATLYPSNPIEIQFVCGYGAIPDVSVPARIIQAILLMITDGYENRQTYHNGTAMTAVEIPGYMNGLLNDYRLGWF